MEGPILRLITRQLATSDVNAILAIQASSPEIAQWAARDYERAARGEMVGWVAEDEMGVAGFLVARPLVHETEILNFAVRPNARRRGIGAALLKEALDWSGELGAEKVTLEVRASNDAALKFYRCYRFHAVGRRPKYYTDPVEDALVLSLIFSGKPSGG